MTSNSFTSVSFFVKLFFFLVDKYRFFFPL